MQAAFDRLQEEYLSDILKLENGDDSFEFHMEVLREAYYTREWNYLSYYALSHWSRVPEEFDDEFSEVQKAFRQWIREKKGAKLQRRKGFECVSKEVTGVEWNNEELAGVLVKQVESFATMMDDPKYQMTEEEIQVRNAEEDS